MREERARVKADTASHRGPARPSSSSGSTASRTILAKTAARDTSLLALLAEDAVVSDAATALKREMLRAAGVEAAPEEAEPAEADGRRRRRPSAASCRSRSISRQLANPFLAPDFSAAAAAQRRSRGRLATWELLGPLFRSFEYAAGGARPAWRCPSRRVAARRRAASS